MTLPSTRSGLAYRSISEKKVEENAMTQIYTYAIENSRVGKPEYVLSKSLHMVRTNNENRVMMYLKDGYQLRGKFVNGVGEYTYRVSNSPFIPKIKSFIETELLGFEIIGTVDVIIADFQEFFEPITCRREELRLSVQFWKNGESKPEIVRFTGENAEKVRTFLLYNCGNMEQDGTSLLNLLEKKSQKGEP